MKPYLLLLLFIWNASFVMAQEEPLDPAIIAKYEAKSFESSNELKLGYRFFQPKNESNVALPLIIFLHGAGERGDNNVQQLKHGAGDLASDAVQSKQACFVIAPQCAENEKWVDHDWDVQVVEQPVTISKHLFAVFELIDVAVKEHNIDPARIYLTGLSMGGYGTWDAVARRPKFFAAAVPICGGADVKTASQLLDTPIWNFHGAADSVVPVELSQVIIDAIKKAGGEAEYTEYPDLKHNSWTQTYANPELYDWLFKQRR
jgi:predicted peptidase